MISSLSNQKVKYVRRIQSDRRFRHRQQVFVVEGTRWLKELLAYPQELQQVFYCDDWVKTADLAHMLAQFNIDRQCVSEEVMKAMSATEAAPGILAVVSINPLPIPAHSMLVLILDAITDPGNMGTILRSAVAAGVDAALVGPGSVDVYNPKVVRSAMGAHLRLPIHQIEWPAISEQVASCHVWLAAGDGLTAYTAVDWRNPSALIVSNEAHGGSKEARTLATDSIAIPMQPGTESLNVAMATSIILFEAVRQRGLTNNV